MLNVLGLIKFTIQYNYTLKSTVIEWPSTRLHFLHFENILMRNIQFILCKVYNRILGLSKNLNCNTLLRNKIVRASNQSSLKVSLKKCYFDSYMTWFALRVIPLKAFVHEKFKLQNLFESKLILELLQLKYASKNI